MTQKLLKVLLIGRGAREHALAIKIAQSNLVQSIFVIPGNGGTQKSLRKTRNISGIDGNYFPKLLQLAKDLKIDLVVPGPDAPIVNDIEDFFQEGVPYAPCTTGIKCFAPSREAAQIEGSKAFSKDFMARHKIPTAAYANFTDILKAKLYIEDCLEEDPSYRMVIKASGLAAGKGVVFPETIDEAFQALEDTMPGDKFGGAGDEVVVEEFLEGEELSIHTFSDGVTFKSLPAAQDHKRVFDGDEGPNTGGMGCYAPVKAATPSVMVESNAWSLSLPLMV
ncbi:hypothetical protein ACEPPN_006189 [Leptodophora sp. 'Broadleaf-Isolate-01']